MAGRRWTAGEFAPRTRQRLMHQLRERLETVGPRTEPSGERSYALADVIAALSFALDITEGQPEGHSTKSCLIAMRIAEVIGLESTDKTALFYACLLKDAGCSSNAAKVCSLFDADDRAIKRSFKIEDLTRKADAFKYMVRKVSPERSVVGRAAKLVAALCQPDAGKEMIQTRCSKGAQIAIKLGFCEKTADAIRALDEHWDGLGEPLGIRGDSIPLLGRIACLAQTVEVYFRTYGLIAALDMAEARSGKWFDPDLVQAFLTLRHDEQLWERVDCPNANDLLVDWEPLEERQFLDEARLDAIAEAFADVIDAKSPWTLRHSFGVADATEGIFRQLGYPESAVRYWRRAALLHDIGKLGVSNLVLDKPGRLTEDEFAQMKKHVDYTRHILRAVPCFRSFADDAAAHHEKLDGSGYSLGLDASSLSAEARVLCVADIYDALSAKRPYRKGQMSLEQVFDIMSEQVEEKLCPIAYEALRLHVDASGR